VEQERSRSLKNVTPLITDANLILRMLTSAHCFVVQDLRFVEKLIAL